MCGYSREAKRVVKPHKNNRVGEADAK